MAENIENNGCSQMDGAEHEEYAKARRSFNRIWKERDSALPKLMDAILFKDNFNRAYKRVKANKGAPGIDGMTIEEALPYLKEHQHELTDRIYRRKYMETVEETENEGEEPYKAGNSRVLCTHGGK